MKRGHLPLRTCIGCRQVRPKPALLRLVQTDGGRCTLDANHRSSGRGSYLCLSVDCYQKALKRGSFKNCSNQNNFYHQISSILNAANSKKKLKGC